MSVRLFLQQPLYSQKGEHPPTAAMVLEGVRSELNAFRLRFQVQKWFDDKGKELTGGPRDLLIPAAKVDHVAYQ